MQFSSRYENGSDVPGEGWYVDAKNGYIFLYVKEFSTYGFALLSDKCDIITVISPSGEVITGKNITATVDNSVTSKVIDVTVSENATWKLYSDPECTQEITDKTMALSVGINTAYIKVTAQDIKISATYVVTITRNSPNIIITYYTLTISDGGAGSSGGGTYMGGMPVAIDAGTKDGYAFAGWTTSSGGAFGNSNSAVTIFTMPYNNATVTAVWVKLDESLPYIPEAESANVTETVYVPVIIARNGTVQVTPKTPAPNVRATVTVRPDEGYTLDKLTVTDSAGKAVKLTDNNNGTYSFIQPYGRVVVTAVFKKTGDHKCTDFTDIDGHWAQDNICYCVENGLFNGMTATTFEPESSITRAMFVTVLARIDGFDLSDYTTSRFNDIPDGTWYTATVEWAADKGIVMGVGNGKFDPDARITREQMAVMLYRYIAYKGYTLKSVSDKIIFNDDGKFSSWAKEAIESIQLAGIINGKPGNIYDPQGIATRAEAATVFAKFAQLIEK